MQKARIGRPYCRPHISFAIHRAEHDERQLRIEGAVLVDQMIAQHPSAELFHTLANTGLILQQPFARMPG
ncbi:hypothetical protein D3C87_1955220 [compost metagenome]